MSRSRDGIGSWKAGPVAPTHPGTLSDLASLVPAAALTLITAITMAITLVTPEDGLAQQANIGSSAGDAGFRMEMVKPFFRAAAFGFFGDLTFFSTTINLSAAIPVSDRLLVDAELPFARAAISRGAGGSSRTLGNPYVGLRTRSGEDGAGLRAGIRLPFLHESGDDDFASGVGAFSDFQRVERYLDEWMAFVTAVTYRRSSDGVDRLGLEAGTVISTGTGGGSDETDVWLTYGASMNFPTGSFRIGLGMEGRLLTTESGLNLGERSFHHLNVEGGRTEGRIRPRIRIGVPVDDELGEIVSYIIGIGVDIPLGF